MKEGSTSAESHFYLEGKDDEYTGSWYSGPSQNEKISAWERVELLIIAMAWWWHCMAHAMPQWSGTCCLEKLGITESHFNSYYVF